MDAAIKLSAYIRMVRGRMEKLPEQNDSGSSLRQTALKREKNQVRTAAHAELIQQV
jgi:hypothetical protein